MSDLRIPVLRVRNCYLISLLVELTDRDVLALQETVLERLASRAALGVVVDVSALDVIDSYIARVFSDMGQAARTMGARTVIVGLRPEIAMTLVDMGVDFEHVETARDVDMALDRLLGIDTRARRKTGSPEGTRRGRAEARVRAHLQTKRADDSARAPQDPS